MLDSGAAKWALLAILLAIIVGLLLELHEVLML